MRDKQPSLSEHDIDAIADAVAERTGPHRAIPSTPPMLRWIQKWWWKVTIAGSIEAGGHWIHEVIAQYLRHR